MSYGVCVKCLKPNWDAIPVCPVFRYRFMSGVLKTIVVFRTILLQHTCNNFTSFVLSLAGRKKLQAQCFALISMTRVIWHIGFDMKLQNFKLILRDKIYHWSKYLWPFMKVPFEAPQCKIREGIGFSDFGDFNYYAFMKNVSISRLTCIIWHFIWYVPFRFDTGLWRWVHMYWWVRHSHTHR